MFGEMGGNPIRARRRDANKLQISLPNATVREMSLENALRRRNLCRKVEISRYYNPLYIAASAGKKGNICKFRRKRK